MVAGSFLPNNSLSGLCFRTEALLVITNNALAHANGVEDEACDRELQILRHENKIAHLKSILAFVIGM